MIEVIYKDRSNPNTVTFYQDSVAIPFAGVTRMTCAFAGSAVIADSAVDPGLFDWSAGSGVVEFNFTTLALPPGTYKATLVAYDALHPAGQVLVHMRTNELIFIVVDA